MHDANSNGTIDIEDFLSILGLFADVDQDQDGVWDTQDDCLDETACNYSSNPTVPCEYLDAAGECGGDCEGDSDGDGVCDDMDTCVGILDECGVCNGPGPDYVIIEEIIFDYDSVYIPQIEEWYVFVLTADTIFDVQCDPDIPCEGTLALLTGCENPKTWKFSSEVGYMVGPEPGSSEWYASPPAEGLPEWQRDDRWSLTEDGEFLYDNNGATMNPYEAYVEWIMSIQPSTYALELGAGPNGEDLLTIGALITEEGSELCGWMGIWDSGPTYTINEITHDRLVLVAPQQGGDCVNPVNTGYFTITFEAE